MSTEFTPIYDLDSLNEAQRQEYVRHLCKHLGVPPELNLVMLTYIDSSEGPRRLVPYAKRGAAEIIRNTYEINVEELSHVMVGGSIVFTAVGKNKFGRREMSTGSKYIEGLKGDALDDSIMTAQTRAIRRMTLQFIGGGILDESEVTNRGVTLAMKSDTVQTPALQPVVTPNTEPGKDITEAHTLFLASGKIDEEKGVTVTLPPHSGDTIKIVPEPVFTPVWNSQEEFEASQAKMRAEAIASLNKKAEPETSEQPRKKRGRGKAKPKVDMGPSEPVPVAVATAKPEAVQTPLASPVPEQAVVAASPATPAQAALSAPPVPIKPQLSAAEVQPYRTRLFQIVNNSLEPAGFAPREGMGNADKMRSLASIMFRVVNLKELTAAQWESYLSTLEAKVSSEGPAATIKYVEETIGL